VTGTDPIFEIKLDTDLAKRKAPQRFLLRRTFQQISGVTDTDPYGKSLKILIFADKSNRGSKSLIRRLWGEKVY
jgi:hypothetical protein